MIEPISAIATTMTIINTATTLLGKLRKNKKVDNKEVEKTISDLVDKIKFYENWEQIAAQYELCKMPGGALVYEYNRECDPVDKDITPHLLCPRCFEQKRKSLLQPFSKYMGTEICPLCDKKFKVHDPEDDFGDCYIE